MPQPSAAGMSHGNNVVLPTVAPTPAPEQPLLSPTGQSMQNLNATTNAPARTTSMFYGGGGGIGGGGGRRFPTMHGIATGRFSDY